jgi:CubicO group peptidase (beta-lactamase class C family)
VRCREKSSTIRGVNRRLGCLLTLLAVCTSTLRGADQPKEPQTIAELQTAIEQVLHDTHTPGAAVAIVSTDRVEWTAGLGLADVATNRAATSKTLFRIGSISKSFAALVALKLQEEGKLKLTDTLHQWAPEIEFRNQWEQTDPIRLEHLMEHTSGLPDMQMPEYAHSQADPIALADALKLFPQYRVTRWRPGSRGAYSNTGPALLAYVIEKVTGRRFEDVVHDELFVPLGMNSATYFRTPEAER